MKKLIALILIAILFATCLVGCGTNTTSTSTKDNNVSDKEVVNVDVPTNDNKYYPFIEEVDNRPSITITLSEFLDKYNSIKPQYEDHAYVDLEESDFIFIQEGNNNGTEVEAYGCPLTIFGRNDSFAIIVFLNKGTSIINQVAFRVMNFEIYESMYMDFCVQYMILAEALGIPNDEAKDIVGVLLDEGKETGYYGTYSKGLAFFIDSGNGTFFRILPMTEDEYISQTQ